MLNNMLLNNEWVNNEIRKKIKTYLETNENEHTTTQNLGGPVKTVLGNTGLSKEDGKNSNKQPKSTSKELE